MRSRKLRLHIGASRLHRWLGLLLGVQLLLWFTSGLVMSLLPIDRVRGEHLVDREAAAMLPGDTGYAPTHAILAAGKEPIRQFQVRMLLGRPVVEVQTASGAVRLHDARTGAVLPPVGSRDVATIALAAYRGGSKIAPQVERVSATSTEYKGKVPAWRAVFPDPDATRVYVDDTGKIVAVRTGTWRLYDFFWGLHIIDWTEHEHFNTPWMWAFATGGLALAIAGTILLYLRWPRRKRKPA